MRFIDLNWDINNIHKYPQRVNEIHSPVLFGFGSTKGLGHTHEYSTSFTHSFQPQAKLPMLQQKFNIVNLADVVEAMPRLTKLEADKAWECGYV